MGVDTAIRMLIRETVQEVIQEQLRALVPAPPAASVSTEMLSVHEAAARLRVEPKTIRAWIQKGKLRAYRAGRVLRVRQADLEAFLCAPARKAASFEEQASRILAKKAS